MIFVYNTQYKKEKKMKLKKLLLVTSTVAALGATTAFTVVSCSSRSKEMSIEDIKKELKKIDEDYDKYSSKDTYDGKKAKEGIDKKIKLFKETKIKVEDSWSDDEKKKLPDLWVKYADQAVNTLKAQKSMITSKYSESIQAIMTEWSDLTDVGLPYFYN